MLQYHLFFQRKISGIIAYICGLTEQRNGAIFNVNHFLKKITIFRPNNLFFSVLLANFRSGAICVKRDMFIFGKANN